MYRNINTTPEICWLYCRQRYKASSINDFLPFSFFSSFVKDALTKNPKRRPTAEKMLYHKFLLAGDLNMRLSLELLNKVRNPEAASLSTSSSTSGLPSSSQGMKSSNRSLRFDLQAQKLNGFSFKYLGRFIKNK